MGRRILLAVRHEHITASAHRLDEARRGRIGFEDPAQTPHLHVDTPVGAVVFRTVQQFEQALARQRAEEERAVSKEVADAASVSSKAS